MQGTPDSPLYLTILRKGETNFIDMVGVGTLVPRSELQISNDFLDELATEMTRLAALGHGRREGASHQENLLSSDSQAFVRGLQHLGGLLFSHLLTEPARKHLRAAHSGMLYLRLDEQLIHLPWELCYDGADFFATKFLLGRQVITSQPIPESRREREAEEGLRVLLIADPTESLPEANNEAELLCTVLDTIPGADVTLLGGKGLRKVALLAALQAHDVVHFAGHSYYDSQQPHRSGWRLHDDVLTAGELSRLNRPPLLVFSNSCQAGATTAWTDAAQYDQQAFGIGGSFLLAGVKNYIGTFWVVHDEESVLFATTFYQQLVTGRSLGAALLCARQEVIAQRGWVGLTWASYMLYGDPAFRLLPSAAAAPAPPDFRTPPGNDLLSAAHTDEDGARIAVRQYESEQCARLDLLGRPVSLVTHYQVLPLLREVKRERLPRQSSISEESAQPEERAMENHHGLREVDILRWEEELREEHVVYAQASLADVFRQFRSVAKEAKSDTPRFVVLGPPGSGKTTLLQYLSWHAVIGGLQGAEHPLLPIRVRLRDWEAWASQSRAAEQGLPHYLTHHYAHLFSAPDAAQWTRWLQQGETLLMLDGLDEIEGKPTFLSLLHAALETYGACPTILTCRTVSFEQYRRLCADFPLFTLSSLEPRQRDAYIRAFPATPHGAYDPDVLISHLTRTPSFWPLAANPLLLSIICYVADEGLSESGLPTTRGSFYQRAVKKLLIQRSQHVEARYPGAAPTVDEKLTILEDTAFLLFAQRQHRLSFTGQELGHALRQALEAAGYGEAAAPWANAFRVDILHNSGLIRGNDTHGFFFLHLTVQEFLAARALARYINDHGWEARPLLTNKTTSLRRLVNHKAWDPRWQEIILLLAGQLTDPLPLFQLLTQEKSDDLFRCRLALAALCLSEVRMGRSGQDADMVDHITTAVFSLWRRYEQHGAAAAVTHLTHAFPALGRCNGRWEDLPLLQSLSQQMQATQSDIRASAITALGHINGSFLDVSGPELLPGILNALHDRELVVRIEALEALRRIGVSAAHHPALIPALLQTALYAAESILRSGAARVLEQVHGTAIWQTPEHSALEAARLDDNPQIRARAEELQLRLEAVTQPQSFTRHRQEESTEESVARNQLPVHILSLVNTALHDAHPLTRTKAAGVLERGEAEVIQQPDAIPLLLQAIESEDGGVRTRATRLLKLLGPTIVHHPKVVATLTAVALHDRSSSVRAEAVTTLGWLEEAAVTHPGLLIALVHALQHDRDGAVRARAAGALGRLGKIIMRRSASIAALVAALHDNDEEVRWRAAEALERLQSQGVRLFRRWWKKIEAKTVEELARV